MSAVPSIDGRARLTTDDNSVIAYTPAGGTVQSRQVLANVRREGT